MIVIRQNLHFFALSVMSLALISALVIADIFDTTSLMTRLDDTTLRQPDGKKVTSGVTDSTNEMA